MIKAIWRRQQQENTLMMLFVCSIVVRSMPAYVYELQENIMVAKKVGWSSVLKHWWFIEEWMMLRPWSRHLITWTLHRKSFTTDFLFCPSWYFFILNYIHINDQILCLGEITDITSVSVVYHSHLYFFCYMPFFLLQSLSFVEHAN